MADQELRVVYLNADACSAPRRKRKPKTPDLLRLPTGFPLERLLGKVLEAPGGHAVWAGARDKETGDGVFYWRDVDGEKREASARRLLYLGEVGEIPSHYKVIVSCSNSHCVLPAHLSVVPYEDRGRNKS